MKRFLLTPIFKTFKRRTFFSSLEQNNCPVYDAEEIKKQEQKEAIKKLYPCLLYTSPSPRDRTRSRMPSSA